jgi:hypothetical protein
MEKLSESKEMNRVEHHEHIPTESPIYQHARHGNSSAEELTAAYRNEELLTPRPEHKRQVLPRLCIFAPIECVIPEDIRFVKECLSLMDGATYLYHLGSQLCIFRFHTSSNIFESTLKASY